MSYITFKPVLRRGVYLKYEKDAKYILCYFRGYILHTHFDSCLFVFYRY